MKKKLAGLLVIVLMVFSCTSKTEKDKWAKEDPEIKYSEAREKEVWGEILRGRNPALFYGTPLYDLAETLSGAIWFRDKEEIAQLIDAVPKEYINFQEGKFGMTIGQFALRTNNMFAIRKLLDRGLNSNIMDNMGNAIIIDINNYTYGSLPESLETLKYMIKKGANVNLYSEKAQSSTPLIEASQMGRLENVKILVEAGANPHFTCDFDLGSNMDITLDSALRQALSYGQIEVVNYFIFNQKVDFRTLRYPKKSKFHPDDYIILYKLREMFFELNSKKYQEKMKLVAYLKTQGFDYWKTPVPDRFRSTYSQEYLSKY
ncbi:ankyrin repeat domain-containing protein [Flavobacterium daejeonense]|uniref:ankyrin repeat domain-containing protein n=1 Tax=Flavobacterium daejeonense TaxID=350893 RepID=UPI00047A01C8|nr:ankyrin repeat domain-containing protein [Flavobacterium daejeonense]